MTVGMSDTEDVPANTSSDHDPAEEPEEPEIIDLTGETDSESEEEDEDEIGSQQSDDSDSSGVEIALNEETRGKLQEAILGVSEIRLRHIIQRIAEEVPEAEEALIRELITLKRETMDVIPRWEFCRGCNEEFDMALPRQDGECVFHPGTLRSSREDRNGVIGIEHPEPQQESFSWSCCNTDSTSGGCTSGQHQPALAKKRRRIEEDS